MIKYLGILKTWGAMFLIVMLVAHSANAQDSSAANNTNEANRAPDFSLRALNGEQVSLENMQEDGHVLLLFWSMDCVYCVAHMSDYERLHENYKDKGLTVAAINIGGENYEDIADYARENDLSFILLSNRQHNFKVAEQYAVMATPTLILISPEGEVLYRGHAIPEMSQWFTEEQKIATQNLP